MRPGFNVPYVSVSLLAVPQAMVFAGDKVFQYLNVAPPAWYTQNVATNRFGYAMGVWFFGNTIVTNLQNTGAFEVYFDGQLVGAGFRCS